MILKELNTEYLLNLQEFIDRVDSKQSIIDNARPLSSTIVSKLKDNLSLEWTYNSNAIEGNTLSLIETKVVLQDGMTIGKKSLREHFEVINHDQAIHFLNELVHTNYTLRCIDILSIHDLVLNNIDSANAGRIRNIGVYITGANFIPPSPSKVSLLLDELVDFVNNNPLDLHPIALATILHHNFVWIHPFTDGNGRTARLLMNLILQKAGYPPSIILKNDRQKYYKALNSANNGNYQKLTTLILQGLERSLNLYLNIIPGAYQEYESIAQIAKDIDVPYGSEYISLLARKGLIDAHKQGRNWVTTKKAVLDYYSLVSSK